MVRKTGQIIRCGPGTWLVRVYAGRDSKTRKRKYIGRAVFGARQPTAERTALRTTSQLLKECRA